MLTATATRLLLGLTGCLLVSAQTIGQTRSTDTATLDNAHATVGMPYSPSGAFRTAWAGCCPSPQACNFYVPASETYLHARQTGAEMQLDAYLYYLASVTSYTFTTPGEYELDLYVTCPPQRYGEDFHARNFKFTVSVAPASSSTSPQPRVCHGVVINGHCVRA
jgi:hypothetical protein